MPLFLMLNKKPGRAQVLNRVAADVAGRVGRSRRLRAVGLSTDIEEVMVGTGIRSQHGVAVLYDIPDVIYPLEK